MVNDRWWDVQRNTVSVRVVGTGGHVVACDMKAKNDHEETEANVGIHFFLRTLGVTVIVIILILQNRGTPHPIRAFIHD